jgi:hypothetical protein
MLSMNRALTVTDGNGNDLTVTLATETSDSYAYFEIKVNEAEFRLRIAHDQKVSPVLDEISAILTRAQSVASTAESRRFTRPGSGPSPKPEVDHIEEIPAN